MRRKRKRKAIQPDSRQSDSAAAVTKENPHYVIGATDRTLTFSRP